MRNKEHFISLGLNKPETQTPGVEKPEPQRSRVEQGREIRQKALESVGEKFKFLGGKLWGGMKRIARGGVEGADLVFLGAAKTYEAGQAGVHKASEMKERALDTATEGVDWVKAKKLEAKDWVDNKYSDLSEKATAGVEAIKQKGGEIKDYATNKIEAVKTDFNNWRTQRANKKSEVEMQRLMDQYDLNELQHRERQAELKNKINELRVTVGLADRIRSEAGSDLGPQTQEAEALT